MADLVVAEPYCQSLCCAIGFCNTEIEEIADSLLDCANAGFSTSAYGLNERGTQIERRTSEAGNDAISLGVRARACFDVRGDD